VVAEGATAPDFEAQSDEGRTIKLSDLRGNPVVLYFYPKDDTPGCTTQACGIRDAWGEFETAGIQVLGVSRDGIDDHKAFKEKFGLQFPLLADEDQSIARAYGVDPISEEFPGYKRTTVLIDADGNVVRRMENVDPSTHADDVLSALS
jgi:thioredoxin-dependent peroxiredoxin